MGGCKWEVIASRCVFEIDFSPAGREQFLEWASIAERVCVWGFVQGARVLLGGKKCMGTFDSPGQFQQSRVTGFPPISRRQAKQNSTTHTKSYDVARDVRVGVVPA